MRERLGIAGSGAIACGLAATAAAAGEVVLWARSRGSAERAERSVEKACGRMEDVDPSRVRVETDLDALRSATAVVEAIAEHREAKGALLSDLGGRLPPETLLATTTSSLPVGDLAATSGRPDRFCGLHVFNPVPRMKLVEVVFPDEASRSTRERALGLCEDLGKMAVEVPDIPGFVVNRLLFPYLFSAVRLLDETGLEPEAIDTCMTLGTGHPMGPLALLDLIGIDVAIAIGEEIGADVPPRLLDLAEDEALGRKTGRGLYEYADR